MALVEPLPHLLHGRKTFHSSLATHFSWIKQRSRGGEERIDLFFNDPEGVKVRRIIVVVFLLGFLQKANHVMPGHALS